MKSMHYIGFDIHKKVISFREKQADGNIVEQGVMRATRQSLLEWVGRRSAPWIGAMEATLCIDSGLAIKHRFGIPGTLYLILLCHIVMQCLVFTLLLQKTIKLLELHKIKHLPDSVTR